MSKSDSSDANKQRSKTIRWVITIFIVTIFISGTISLVSEEIMADSSIPVAFLILLAIVLIGILFDVVGVAVTSADEAPFHAMAARKVPGSHESIKLLRNAEKVGSICNDVIGDICGVISGSASATIAAQVIANSRFDNIRLMVLIMSSLVAGFTVGGKAIGKRFAIHSCTTIVFTVGKIINWFGGLFRIFSKDKSK